MFIRKFYQHAVKAPGLYCYTHRLYKCKYRVIYIPNFNIWMIYVFKN